MGSAAGVGAHKPATLPFLPGLPAVRKALERTEIDAFLDTPPWFRGAEKILWVNCTAIHLHRTT